MGINSSTAGSLAEDEDHFASLIEMMGTKKPLNASQYIVGTGIASSSSRDTSSSILGENAGHFFIWSIYFLRSHTIGSGGLF